MSLKDEYRVVEVDKGVATEIVVKNHYLHRKPPISIALALIETDSGKIMGICTYGVPPSHTLLKGICGEDEKQNVYELNRLWVDDSMPKNSESFFVSQTFKFLDKEIIVSFADTSQEHVGYVYQALNFLYCGLSAKFKDPKVKGLENQHHATYAHGMNNNELREKYGDKLYFADRPRKHRYIYFNAKSKARKKHLRKSLKYDVLAYPKG